MGTEDNIDMNEAKRLKDKINNVKCNVLEGIKIRARVKEQIDGEKPSSTLLGKQSHSKNKPLITKIKTEPDATSYEPDVILDNQNDISNYIINYFENMYSEKITDMDRQNWFLSFIDKTISGTDNAILLKEITESEIFNIMEKFSKNKSPGIDGLPIEFYLRFFHIIKKEFCHMIRSSILGEELTETQRKAIIILIFKGGDYQLISSWRPISLICVDAKIISKILAARIKPLLNKCVSREQYCGGENSIIHCNNTTRDILTYLTSNNETGALVNIDLQKAFDSVDHHFLFKILDKMGFHHTFISWIRVLYTNTVSLCLINGHKTRPFTIKRGVRQGCPLSMILYVLAQEPLYQAIKQTRQIKPIGLPCRETKLLGFADDTTIFVKTELSITYIFYILEYFEEASSIRMNVSKTRIFGFGEWRGSENWPYPHIKVEVSSINILGITYAHEINTSVDIAWSDVLLKIKRKICSLSSRSFTIFQRALIINTIILSKVWYIAHTYPLPSKYSKLINKEIFPYLWLSKYNPLKRDNVHQCKYNGGLGVLNVLHKAQSILVSTFLKQFLNSQEDESILKYYCSLRVNPIFNIRETPLNVSSACPK